MLGLDIEQDAWTYARAAHEYYHGSGESLLTDSEYDALTEIFCHRWSEIPEELKILFESPKSIRTTGMHIKLTEKPTDAF